MNEEAIRLISVLELLPSRERQAVRLLEAGLREGSILTEEELRKDLKHLKRLFMECPMGEHCLTCKQLKQRELAYKLLIGDYSAPEGLEWLRSELI